MGATADCKLFCRTGPDTEEDVSFDTGSALSVVLDREKLLRLQHIANRAPDPRSFVPKKTSRQRGYHVTGTI